MHGVNNTWNVQQYHSLLVFTTITITNLWIKVYEEKARKKNRKKKLKSNDKVIKYFLSSTIFNQIALESPQFEGNLKGFLTIVAKN